jgi:hypothetical protein
MTKELEIELAKFLIFFIDSYYDDTDVMDIDSIPIYDVIRMWRDWKEMLNKEPWVSEKHYGDCTRVPMTCHRCLMGAYEELAEKAVNKSHSE